MTLTDPLIDTSPTYLSALGLRVWLERPILQDETGVKSLGDIEYKVAGVIVILDDAFDVYKEVVDRDILNLLTATEKQQLQAMTNRLAALVITALGLPTQP